jgi:DHA1 family bicyclomycin/chloramphenicol resistance-like MFS transporter
MFAIIGIGFLFGNFLTGRFSTKVGVYNLMLWGCLISLIGPAIHIVTLANIEIGAIGLFGPMFFVGLGNGLTLPNAVAGIVSGNPRIAGSASGLGSTIQISIGGLLAFLTGYITSIQPSPYPLVLIIFVAIIISLIFTYLVKYAD